MWKGKIVKKNKLTLNKSKKSSNSSFKKRKKVAPRKIKKVDTHQAEIAEIAKKYQISNSLAACVYKKILTPERALLLYNLGNYKKENYHINQLELDMKESIPLVFHIHGAKCVEGKIVEMSRYEFVYEDLQTGEKNNLKKIELKFFYPLSLKESIQKLIKIEEEVAKKKIGSIEKPAGRNHIKNKTLYPLMMNKDVVFLTTLEGDVIRGIISGFSRYEIKISMKGGIPVTILRHAVYDLTDKEKKISYLKKKVVA